MKYIPDAYDQYEKREREIADIEAHWPRCHVCGEMLEDTAYRLDDALMCYDCAQDWLEQQKEKVEVDE